LFQPELDREDQDALIMFWGLGSADENGVEGLHLELRRDVCAIQSLLVDIDFTNDPE
jgi:hypothetical protein